jgi:microcystin-dependent protein
MKKGVMITILVFVIASATTVSAKEPKQNPFIELWDMIEELRDLIENTPPPEDGLACWDLNENGIGDLPDEDINGDGVVNVSDCQGPPGEDGTDGAPGTDGADGADGADGGDGTDGLACWDLNGNGTGDLPDEDINGDGVVNVSDCQGPPGEDGDDGAIGAKGADGIDGLACWDLNGNGTGDLPEEDINEDGVVNVFDCQGADGIDGIDGPTHNHTHDHTHTILPTGGGQAHNNMQPFTGVYHVIALTGIFPSRNSEPFIGQIQMVGFNFAPRGWAFCDGQLLPISQHTALYSLLGTTYGGDGHTTFALPDLRGRVAIHPGNGPGVDQITLGQKGGANKVALTVGNMPSHTHTALNASVNATWE